MTATITLNEKLNGIELSFPEKPTDEILTQLKTNGYRWHNVKKVWYARQNEKTISLAEKMVDCETEVEAIPKDETKTVIETKKEISPLFDRVQIIEDLNNVDEAKSGKEIASIVRKHIRERFPECKFSVTCRNYNSINITLESSPYIHTEIESTRDISTSEHNRLYEKANKETTSIIKYCENYLNSFKYCTSYDPYGDYGSSYNIYVDVRLSYNYEQTELTDEYKKVIEDFHAALIEKEKQDEIKRQEEFEKYKKEQAEKQAAFIILEEQRKKDKEIIEQNVSSVELEESKQYILSNVKMANLNKNNTLTEYYEEVAKDDYYTQNIKITREISFSTEESLNLFNNMLLTDFDFLADSGGTYTDDPRINNMIDYHNMTKEEQETVKFNLIGIAVYYNNILQFIIDTQGYKYARYVGLVDDIKREEIESTNTYTEDSTIKSAKIEAIIIEDKSTEIITALNLNAEEWKDSTEYKTQLKTYCQAIDGGLTKSIIQQIEIEDLKVYLYKLIDEIDSVQEQFSKLDLIDGMKYTAFNIGLMGMVTESKCTYHSIEFIKYAQYDDAVKIIMTPYKKRSKYYGHYHSDQCFILVEGWHDLPDEILWNIETKNGMTTRSSKYLSCDKQQIKDIKEYFKNKEVKILVDRSK